LHAVSPVLDIFPGLQQGFVPLVVLVVSIGRWGLLGAVVLAAVIIGWRVLAWSRHSYRIEDGVLRIEEGVLNRQVREIPLTRIQQVDLRRQLRHRALGVVAVRIDTAGGGSGAEAVLDAVSDAHALELRSALLSHRPGERSGGSETVDPLHGPGQAPGTPIGPTQAPEVVAEMSTRDLAIAGITGSGLLAGLSIVGFAFLILDYLPEDTGQDLTDDVANLLGTALVLAVLAVVVVPLWLAVAAGASILRDHEFTLVRYGPDLHLRRGLLDQREATLALHRIQAVWVLDNPIRRRFGLASVQLQSAASGSEASGDVSRVTVPLVRTRDLDRLMDLVLPVGGSLPGLVPAPRAALRRARVRALGLALFLLAAALVVTRSPYGLIAGLMIIPAWVFASRAYSSLGHARTEASLVSRWGAVMRRTVVVPVAKTQSCQLRSTPFQRRVDLATLRVQVAGRGPTVEVVDGDARALGVLRNGVLVAPGARLDEAAVRRRTHAGLEESDAAAGLAEGSEPVTNYRADP